jgi:excisionase family DNA binding protein
MNTDDRLLTINELADLLGVSVATVRWWLHEGTGPDYFKIGRHVKFHSIDVDRWLEARRHSSGSTV